MQLLMETDVKGLIGAGRHERTAERATYRNGYRDRTLDTRLGSLQLGIPKLRQGSRTSWTLYCHSTCFARGTLGSPALQDIEGLGSCDPGGLVGGVSTWRVDYPVQAMGLARISKSTVGKLCKDIDDRMNAFLERPLDGAWPYPWLDATYTWLARITANLYLVSCFRSY